MAYIYKIVNDVNQKIYIGKTYHSVERRFKEHCSDSKREHCKNRPLYRAMNKYGIEHFYAEIVEETDCPEEREVYWIEYFGSFKNGYNATVGGDGKPYADYDLIVSLYNQGTLSCTQIQKITGYDKDTISKALYNSGKTHEEIVEHGRDLARKKVAKIDPATGEIVAVYSSVNEAEKHNGNTRHIAQVCIGKRKMCKGYQWKYI